jgi:hypothetical protein
MDKTTLKHKESERIGDANNKLSANGATSDGQHAEGRSRGQVEHSPWRMILAWSEVFGCKFMISRQIPANLQLGPDLGNYDMNTVGLGDFVWANGCVFNFLIKP